MSENRMSNLMKGFSRLLRRTPTPQESVLWSRIRREQLGVKFRRQYVIDNKYIVDFVCLKLKLIIEVDGGQHADSLKDVERDIYLQSKGYKILRFWNNEIESNIEGCLLKIIDSF